MEGISAHRSGGETVLTMISDNNSRRCSARCCCSSRWRRRREERDRDSAYRHPGAAAFFFAIWRLMSSAFGDSSASLALARNASSPPRWSTDLNAFAETRSRTERPSASEISVTFSRFGRNRRLVLMFEWLTLWPTWGPLPVNSQRRDITKPLNPVFFASGRPAGAVWRAKGALEEPRKYRNGAVRSSDPRHCGPPCAPAAARPVTRFALIGSR